MAKRGPKPRKHTKKTETTETTAIATTPAPTTDLMHYLADDAPDNEPVILALVPPDLARCQCEWPDLTQPTFGPKPITRCEQAPTVVAFQKRVPGDPEPTGAMSLCAEHRLMIDHMFPGQCYYRQVTSEKKLSGYA